jgi:hypothetical protein
MQVGTLESSRSVNKYWMLNLRKAEFRTSAVYKNGYIIPVSSSSSQFLTHTEHTCNTFDHPSQPSTIKSVLLIYQEDIIDQQLTDIMSSPAKNTDVDSLAAQLNSVELDAESQAAGTNGPPQPVKNSTLPPSHPKTQKFLKPS